MHWLEDNFNDFFRVYWRDWDLKHTADYRDMALKDFEVIDFNKDAHTVEFIASFDDQPWDEKDEEGKKKNNYFHVDVVMDEEYYRGDENGKNGLWLGDPETYRLGNTHAEREIGKPRESN